MTNGTRDDALGFFSLASANPPGRVQFREDAGSRLLDRVGGIGRAAVQAVKLPGDVLAGRVDPQGPEGSRRAFDLASFLMLAPVGGPLGSLGMGGARLARPLKSRVEKRPLPQTRIGDRPPSAILNQTADIDGNRLDIIYDIQAIGGKNATKTEGALGRRAVAFVDFLINGKLETANIGMKSGLAVLATVEKSFDEFIKKAQPSRLVFQAARPELRPLYERIAQRVAKEHDGVFVDQGRARSTFIIDFKRQK